MNLSWQEKKKETDSSASGNSYIPHGRGQGHVPQNTSSTHRRKSLQGVIYYLPQRTYCKGICDPLENLRKEENEIKAEPKEE